MIKVLSPITNFEIMEDDEKKIKLNSSKSDHFVDLRVGELVIADIDTKIAMIRIFQNQNFSEGLYTVQGTILEWGYDYDVAKIKFSRLFDGVDPDVKYLKISKEKAYLDFCIVPSYEVLENNYKASKGLKYLKTNSFHTLDLDAKWDTVMDGLSEKDRVIGHERIKDEVIAAIVSGKHILLYGPPGTGKTMIANRISKVFNCDSNLFTANSEWTSDDTVGGYTFTLDASSKEQKIEPVDGHITRVILDCNKNISKNFYDSNHEYTGTWVIVDELNRAKIDFAFGALFTALDKDYSVLNLPQYNRYQNEKAEIYIPNTFRLIGTMNNFDKNFLFKFSYALSRRFAHIYIGVPKEEDFENEIQMILNRIKVELIEDYGIDEETLKESLLSLQGVKEIKHIISFLRGYGGKTKIRDVGTAIIIDTLRIYFIQKFVTRTSEDENNIIDISINSIIIPSLEGILEEEDILNMEDICKDYPRVMKSLANFKRIDY